MKKLTALSIVLAALIISGCSSKSPHVNMNDSSSSNQYENGSKDSVINDHSSMSDVDVEIVATPLNTIDQLSQDSKSVYFDFDKFDIRPDMQDIVDYDANLVKNANLDDISIKLEGNCDEFGNDEYNYALGLKRAKSVKDALVSKGVDPTKLSVVTYGKSNPVCTDKTQACNAENRRVDFRFIQ